MLAADAIIADGVDAVFTPTDNTIMAAELSIYEKLAEAKIPALHRRGLLRPERRLPGLRRGLRQPGPGTGDMIAAILVDGADPAETCP